MQSYFVITKVDFDVFRFHGVATPSYFEEIVRKAKRESPFHGTRVFAVPFESPKGFNNLSLIPLFLEAKKSIMVHRPLDGIIELTNFPVEDGLKQSRNKFHTPISKNNPDYKKYRGHVRLIFGLSRKTLKEVFKKSGCNVIHMERRYIEGVNGKQRGYAVSFRASQDSDRHGDWVVPTRDVRMALSKNLEEALSKINK